MVSPQKINQFLFSNGMVHKSTFLATALTIWIVGLATLLPGQVINAEQKRAFQKEDGWVGNADLGFGLTKNTRLILQASSRITAQYHKKKHTLLLLNDLNLLKVDNSSIQNSGFQHVRYNYQVKKFLIPEAFYPWQQPKNSPICLANPPHPQLNW